MLHILYELGRAEHQFRFRFKGEYLRDAYIFEVKIMWLPSATAIGAIHFMQSFVAVALY